MHYHIKYALRVISLVALLTTTMSGRSAELSAEDILSKMRTVFFSKPSVSVLFTIKGNEGNIQGSADMSGSKYFMTTPQLNIWYDGITQWTLVKKSNELNITEPDTEEIMSSNPFSILSAHDSYYSVRRLQNDNGRYKIILIPKDKGASIKSITVLASHTDFLPESFLIEFDDNKAINISVDNISFGNKKSDSDFRFDSNRFKVKEIIDLR